MQVRVGESAVEIIEGDITEMDTEAIVNAANSRLKHSGGVAAAIVKKGGPKIQKESDEIGHCPVGEAVITIGGRLKADYVIHAVGPRMGEGNEEQKLRNAILNSLKLADDNDVASIAFPAISTGIFGYPIDDGARVMLKAAMDYLRGETGLKRVTFCLFASDDYRVFEEELNRQVER